MFLFFNPRTAIVDHIAHRIAKEFVMRFNPNNLVSHLIVRNFLKNDVC
jgi:hypothetical protein